MDEEFSDSTGGTFFTAMLFLCLRSSARLRVGLRRAGQCSRLSIVLRQFAAMTAAPARTQTEEDRLAEIATILAAGLMRVLEPESSPVCAHSGESSLHILPDQSGHPTPVQRRTSDG
jgi:hypothetical protein